MLDVLVIPLMAVPVGSLDERMTIATHVQSVLSATGVTMQYLMALFCSVDRRC